MSALVKERIFEELRKYHQVLAPKQSETGRWNDVKVELTDTEDRLITMLIRLVNGKEIFADAKEELDVFQEKVSHLPTANKNEEGSQSFFSEKITKLQDILTIARQTNFPLRKIRLKKQDIVVTGKKA